jgi:hypothetical protein
MNFYERISKTGQSQWPRGLRHRSAAARLLGSQVRIPARGMGGCLLCLYIVLSCVGRGLCNRLIARPEESFCVSNCMCDHRNPERGPVFQENE